MPTAIAIRYELRDETADDEPFAIELYRVQRRDREFLSGSLDQQRAFIAFERDVQRQTMEAVCPTAKSSIVMIDGEAAGELIVDRTESCIRLIEITLLPEFQRQGIGGAMVRALCDEASERGVPVRLRVAVANTSARSFYARHGFAEVDADEQYIDMEWRR